MSFEERKVGASAPVDVETRSVVQTKCLADLELSVEIITRSKDRRNRVSCIILCIKGEPAICHRLEKRATAQVNRYVT